MGYSVTEDVLSAITHGIGAVLGIVGLVMLVLRGLENGDAYQIVAGSIFGISLVFAYLSSTLYHSFRIPSIRLVLRKLDHCAIYVLIAGTYTGLMLGAIRGAWGWSYFGVTWAIALVGILLKVFRMGQYPRLFIATYLIMGWLCLIGIYPLFKHLPRESFYLMVAGGFIYSIGAIIYSLKKIPYTHVIWHFFVMGGSLTHYLAIYIAYRS